MFFENMKTVEYDFTDYLAEIGIKFSNLQPTKANFSILNVNKVFPLLDSYLSNKDFIMNYELKIGDDPFSISKNLYKSSDYWWLIPYANAMSGFDFPLNNIEISEIANIYYQSSGIYSSKKIYFDLIFEYVEKKKKIKIINPSKFPEVLREINRSIS